MIGKVIQSSEGLAAGASSGQVLKCGAHEALRHYKDGLLKCAPAVPVVDCTERTNLRKYGTADMFFSYRAEVCLETHEEYSEMSSAVEAESREAGIAEKQRLLKSVFRAEPMELQAMRRDSRQSRLLQRPSRKAAGDC